jgi:hypothetical protein
MTTPVDDVGIEFSAVRVSTLFTDQIVASQQAEQ